MSMWIAALIAGASVLAGSGLIALALRKFLKLRYFAAALLVVTLVSFRSGWFEWQSNLVSVILIGLVVGVFGGVIQARARDLL